MSIFQSGIKAYKQAAYIASSLGALGGVWLGRDKLLGWAGDIVAATHGWFLAALDHPILSAIVVTLVVIAVCYALVTRRIVHLLRHCLADEKPDPWFFAIRDSARLIRVARRWPTLEHGRIWVETHLLTPEPEMPDRAAGDSDEAFSAKLGSFQDKRKIWKKQLRRRLQGEPEAWVIAVESCDSMISVRKELVTYFDYVEEHLKTSDRTAQTICKIWVEHGFLAPIFLITGLIAAFKEDWDPIVKAYGRQVNDQMQHFEKIFLESSGAEREFAAFRLFQFNCWLLWGPSIPICTCTQWTIGEVTGFQFGFGDENNSVEMVTRLSDTDGKIRDILRSASRSGIAASTVQIRGHLKPSKLVQRELCRCQKHLLSKELRGKSPERLAIVVDSGRDLMFGDQGSAGAKNFYYSAYIWAMFVVCNTKGELLFPHAPGKTAADDHRWRNLLPFFVHGNIADAATYRRHKYMLAQQICGTVKELLTEYSDISLRFACALDESACGSSTYADDTGRAERAGEGASKESIRVIIAEVVTAAAKHDDDLKGFVESGRLQVLDHKKEKGPRPKKKGVEVDYASCHLPDIIVAYYELPGFSSPS